MSLPKSATAAAAFDREEAAIFGAVSFFFSFRSVRGKINIEEEVRFRFAAAVVSQCIGMITVTASVESGGDDVAACLDEALRQGQLRSRRLG